MGPFNNREIATAFWLLVFLALALRKAEVRKSLTAPLWAFFDLKILAPACPMALYTAAADLVRIQTEAAVDRLVQPRTDT